MSASSHLGLCEDPLTADERAELAVLRDLRKLVIGFGGDDFTVMPWIGAHRLHADEPYIGCPFCRDQFVPVGRLLSDEAVLAASSAHSAARGQIE